MADESTNNIERGLGASGEARKNFQGVSEPIPIPLRSSPSDALVSEQGRAWRDVWKSSRDDFGRACALKCSAPSNGISKLDMESSLDLGALRKTEDLLEQERSSPITEFPNELTVLFTQSRTSFSTLLSMRGGFPRIEHYLYGSMSPLSGVAKRAMLAGSSHFNRGHNYYRWYRLYSGCSERSGAESLVYVQGIVPIDCRNWYIFGPEKDGPITFAKWQDVSALELPGLLILHHRQEDHRHYSLSYDTEQNDPFQRLLDRLEHELQHTVSSPSMPETIMRELHQIMLADELDVLDKLNASIDRIDHNMANDRLLRERLKVWRQLMAKWRPHLYNQYEAGQGDSALIERAKSGVSESDPLSVRWLQEQSIRTKFSRVIEELRSKRRVILEHCESTFTMLMTTMSLIESEKAIREAEEVTKLTQLAFFFIPLTFVAGIYGMNLEVSTCDSTRGYF